MSLLDVAEDTVQNCALRDVTKGQSAYYVKLNHLWAVKFYEDKEDASHTYRLQKHCSKFLAAPPVGESLVVSRPSRLGLIKPFWGYITGVADVETKIPYDAIQELQKLLYSIGIKWKDACWPGNCGWYKGKAVCIDFDSEILGPLSENSSRAKRWMNLSGYETFRQIDGDGDDIGTN